jgi:flagellar motor switch protein FliM
MSKVSLIRNKYDCYEYLTHREREQVTDILSEAFVRVTNIQPEIFEIECNIIVDTIHKD